MHHFKLQPLTASCPGLFRWCLDFPKNEQPAEAATLLKQGAVFQGWVLAVSNAVIEPYVRSGTEKTLLPLSIKRPDVIEKVLKAEPKKHGQLVCGFRAEVPMPTDHGAFGVRVNGVDTDLVLFRIEGTLRILEGHEGWLFLDNDTNRSVEQFRGQWLLEKPQLAAWRSYFDGLAALAQAQGFRYAVLVAPSKETVMAQYYPYPKGKTTPVDQVMALADGHPVVHPVSELQRDTERPFRQCDTHWTPQGAMRSLLAALNAMGQDIGPIEALFAQDVYVDRLQGGDLGNKLYPPRRANERVLKGASYRKWVMYDNHLPNMGRVMMLRNADAVLDERCVIFGSSSSYTMMEYTARVFSEVVFIHSAGHVDAALLRQLEPSTLLLQTNGRFVVRPPVVEYDVQQEIHTKWAELDSQERAAVFEKQQSYLKQTLAGPERELHNLLPD